MINIKQKDGRLFEDEEGNLFESVEALELDIDDNTLKAITTLSEKTGLSINTLLRHAVVDFLIESSSFKTFKVR